jgi:DNA helicase-2/ATP-dependent DNA helicase PcrA
MDDQTADTPIGKLLSGLNEQQRAAVLHGDEPLLVVAGAGTGKTATLAHRVAHRIAAGTDPGRILLLTFTRRAAGEMLRRVDEILRRLETETSYEVAASGTSGVGTSGVGTSGAKPSAAPAQRAPASAKVWGGTFHAIATRLLRLHGRSIGLEPSFTILDRADAEDLMGMLRTELGLSKSDRRFPLKGTCMDIYSRCVNARESVEHAVEEHFPWCKEEAPDLRRLFEAYVDHKQERAVLDYDDLLLFWHGLLTEPRVARSIRVRFAHVLVDEYQDTNRLQAEILQLLSPGGNNLTVVGDDAQAIYSFRAATVHNILDFPRQFPDTRVVTLEQNYRSTQPILDTTNEVIACACEWHAKTLWSNRQGGARPQFVSCQDENEQTEFVVRSVLDHREAGLPLRRQAVLFRASHHSLALEMELARRNIPFRKYGGLRFVETAHVKDLIAFLRLAENPRDLMAGTRVLMLLPGVGPKKARTLMDALGADRDAWTTSPAPSPAAAEAWPQLVGLMAAISGRAPGDLASQLKRIRLFYAPLMERLYDNARARLMDLEQLEWLAARYPDRERFLTEITLDPPAYTEDLAGPPLLDEDFLILSTMHSAKGLEWDAVFVIHASDGNIPSDMATGRLDEIEEERRLFYVALTRAKDWLHVCYPLRYYVHPRSFSDIHGYAQPTRFVPVGVLSTMESLTALEFLAPESATVEDGTDAQAPMGMVTTEDIRQRLKALL